MINEINQVVFINRESDLYYHKKNQKYEYVYFLFKRTPEKEDAFRMAYHNGKYSSMLEDMANRYADELVYVGITCNYYNRLRTHFRQKDFDYAMVIPFKDSHDTLKLENFIIDKLNPRYNKTNQKKFIYKTPTEYENEISQLRDELDDLKRSIKKIINGI